MSFLTKASAFAMFLLPLFFVWPLTAARDSEVGIALGDIIPQMNDPQMAQVLDRQFADMASLNIKWIRVDMPWSDVQPKDDTSYDWTRVDHVVALARAHNLNVLSILDYAPRWAQSAACVGTSSCTPADPALFANFAKAAVVRYGAMGVFAWEVWNEPNLRGSLLPATDASVYARLLRLTYTAIKSVQPSSTVIVGGLAPAATTSGDIAPIDFLTELYAFGARDYFDAFAFHPYSSPAMPSFRASWNAWQQMDDTTPQSLRSVMIANGDAEKRMWITEYGAPTGGPGTLEASSTDTNFFGHPDHVTEAVQEQMLLQAVTSMRRYSWVGPFFWYSYKDLGTNSNTIQNFFGLLRFDGSPKPAYATIRALLFKRRFR